MGVEDRSAFPFEGCGECGLVEVSPYRCDSNYSQRHIKGTGDVRRWHQCYFLFVLKAYPLIYYPSREETILLSFLSFFLSPLWRLGLPSLYVLGPPSVPLSIRRSVPWPPLRL
jgi:hypothetical protein